MLGFDKRYYMSHLPWDEPGKIEVISGAFCFLRRKALDEVGLLDEDYFMYGEDQQVACRAVRLRTYYGIKMVYQLFTATNGNVKCTISYRTRQLWPPL